MATLRLAAMLERPDAQTPASTDGDGGGRCCYASRLSRALRTRSARWHWRSLSSGNNALYRKRQAIVLIVPLGLTIMVLPIWIEVLFRRDRALPTDDLPRWDIIATYWLYTLEWPLWRRDPGSLFEVNHAHFTPAMAVCFGSFGAAPNTPPQIAIEAGLSAVAMLAVSLLPAVTWRGEPGGRKTSA